MRCCKSDWSGLYFVVINPRLLSDNRIDFGLFFFFLVNFQNLLSPRSGFTLANRSMREALEFCASSAAVVFLTDKLLHGDGMDEDLVTSSPKRPLIVHDRSMLSNLDPSDHLQTLVPTTSSLPLQHLEAPEIMISDLYSTLVRRLYDHGFSAVVTSSQTCQVVDEEICLSTVAEALSHGQSSPVVAFIYTGPNPGAIPAQDVPQNMSPGPLVRGTSQVFSSAPESLRVALTGTRPASNSAKAESDSPAPARYSPFMSKRGGGGST